MAVILGKLAPEVADALSSARVMHRRFSAKAAPQGERMPRPATRLRALFDQLMVSPGQPVACCGANGELKQLELFYGFHLRRTRGHVMLLGRWLGAHYHDYVTGRVVHQRDL